MLPDKTLCVLGDLCAATALVLMHTCLGGSLSATVLALYCFQELDPVNSTRVQSLVSFDVHNPEVVATLIGAPHWPALVVLPLAGWAFSTGKRYQSTLLLTTVVVALLSLVVPWSMRHSFGSTLLLKLVTGAVHAVQMAIAAPLVHYRFPQRAGTVMGLNFASIRAGSSIALPLSAALCTVEQWPVSLYFWAGVQLIPAALLLLACRLPRELTRKKSKVELAKTEKVPHSTLWRTILTKRELYLLFAGKFAVAAFQATFLNFIPKYFADVLNLTLGHNALYVTVAFLSAMTTRMSMGLVFDALRVRWGNNLALKVIQHFTTLACVLSMLLLAFLPTTSPVPATILFSIALSATSLSILNYTNAGNLVFHERSPLFHALVTVAAIIALSVVPYLVEFATSSRTRLAWHAYLAGSAVVLMGTSSTCAQIATFVENTEASVDTQVALVCEERMDGV